MPLLYSILPLLFSFLPLSNSDTLLLQQDIAKDVAILEKSKGYFIDDNSMLEPSLATIATDLQLFQLTASLDLAKADYTSETRGKHQVKSWKFKTGDIKAIHQIETTIQLDTLVSQRYLDNRPPTQLRIQNTFNFRAYVVATETAPAKLYYLTEAEQGLLGYKIMERQVQIGYSNKKEGLADVLPAYEAELQQVLQSIK